METPSHLTAVHGQPCKNCRSRKKFAKCCSSHTARIVFDFGTPEMLMIGHLRAEHSVMKTFLEGSTGTPEPLPKPPPPDPDPQPPPPAIPDPTKQPEEDPDVIDPTPAPLPA